MNDKEHGATPAEVVIGRLEAKLQAALVKKGLRRCSICQIGILKQDVRDASISRQNRSATVRNIEGLFCDHCAEVEFDAKTDSARRFANAGDRLVFKNRAAQKWRSLNPKHGRPNDGFARTLLHAIQDAWKGYFAPLWMVAWLINIPLKWSGSKSSLHKVGERTITVMTLWDSEADAWVAWSTEVPGLITEAPTMSELSEKLKTLVPELLVANRRPTGDISVTVMVTQFEDRYPEDDGPLPEQQVAALRADVQKHFPRGKLISRRELFK